MRRDTTRNIQMNWLSKKTSPYFLISKGIFNKKIIMNKSAVLWFEFLHGGSATQLVAIFSVTCL